MSSCDATVGFAAGWAAPPSTGGAAVRRRPTPRCGSAAPHGRCSSVGLQDLGTGTITASAIVVAERLGVPVESVKVQAGDTSLAAHGPMSGGSMTLSSIAPAVRSAGHHARTQLLELAADLFEISASDLTLEGGEVRSIDGTLRRPITEVTAKLGNAWVTGRGSRGPNPADLAVNTFGCQIAEVAVDTATGVVTIERIVAVHDVGRIINPMGARSQAHRRDHAGHRVRHDRGAGGRSRPPARWSTPASRTTRSRRWPTHPRSCASSSTIPIPACRSGVKGLGEPPIIPTAGAIGNAIAHALGVRLHEAPYTPRRVLEALAG